MTSNGKIRYQLKTPYRDGTTHVIFPGDEAVRITFPIDTAGRVESRSWVSSPCCSVQAKARENQLDILTAQLEKDKKETIHQNLCC